MTNYNCLFNMSVIPSHSNTSPIFSVKNQANHSSHSTRSGPCFTCTNFCYHTTVFIMCLSIPVIQVPFSQSKIWQISVSILPLQVPVSPVRLSVTIYNCLYNVSVIPSNTSSIFSVQYQANPSPHSDLSGPCFTCTNFSYNIQLSF